MSDLTLKIIEKQILHCWIDNPNLVFEDEIWVSENAKEFSFIILDLIDKHIDLIPEHILAERVEYVDEESLESILSTNYQLDMYTSYKEKLNTQYLIKRYSDTIKYDLNSENLSDDKKLELLESDLEALKSRTSSLDNNGITFSELIENHKQIIDKRAKGVKNSIGDFMFDRIMPNPTAGIAILAGFSGSMKSTMCTHLAKTRIVKRLPTLFLNSELSLDSYVDILTSSMIDEPIEDIMNMGNEDGHIDFDKIKDKYDFLAEHYANKAKFMMYNKSTMKISEMKPFIISARRKFEMKDDDLLVFFVDLLSMISDFQSGTSPQNAILKGINKINEIALETNTLVFGTIQLKRAETVHIKKLEDIDKFRVSASAFKESSEWENRCRWAGCIMNPTNIVNKNPCDPIVKELVEPILEVYVVKNTYTDTLGQKAYWYIDTEHKSLIPYEKEEDEDTSVRPINIDESEIKSYEG